MLGTLLATITRNPRQRVFSSTDFEWSDNSWTHNVFRTFELLFGRAYGTNGIGDTIRRESGTWVLKDENGEEVVYQAFYTLEASVAHIETLVREFIGSFEMPKVYVYAPRMALPGLPFTIPAGYMFAIARDNSSYANRTTSGTTFSYSLTCTGSNLVLVNFAYSPTNADTITATYNSVSMTQVDAVGATNDSMTSFVLVAPATGANTLAMAASSGFPLTMGAISYSGAKQTGQPDAHNAGFSNSATSVSFSVTTVDNNSWIAGMFYNGQTAVSSASGAFTILHASTNVPSSGDWSALATLDTNGAITPAAATTVGCSNGGTLAHVVLCAISISPSVATTNGNFFAFM